MRLDLRWPRARYDFRPASDARISEQATLAELLKYTDDGGGQAGYLVALTEPKFIKPDEKWLTWALVSLTGVRNVPFKDVVVEIANKLGMLEGRSTNGETETMVTWLRLQSRLREIIRCDGLVTDAGDTTHLHDLQLHLLPGRPPTLAVRPQSLSAALQIYAAQKVATGMELATCLHCKGPFLRGGGRGTNKRGSQFCEPRCKSAYYNKLNRA